MRFVLFKHVLYREPPGVIGPNACWVFLYRGYGHFDSKLWRLLWSVLTEYRDDKHMTM